MADNQDYQEALREASSAAWDQDWERAIQLYEKALTAKPDDAQALTGLALSVLESGNTDRALGIYQKVVEIVPDDPLPHERMADIYEGMGQLDKAALEHLRVAEVYHTRKDLDRAVEHWIQSAALNADMHQPHMRLAALYERSNDTHEKAIMEYIEMARLLQSYGELGKAEQALKRAMRLDTLNSDLRVAIDDLKQGRPLQRTPAYSGVTAANRKKTAVSIKSSDVEEDEDLELLETPISRTPTDEAARHAMSILADSIWDGQMPANAQVPLLQAIDLQQVGDAEGAVEAYAQVLQAGGDSAALRFNLGLLYHYVEDHEQAVRLLKESVNEPEYKIAGFLALGLSNIKLGNSSEGFRQVVESLREADRRTNPSQVDEMGYDRLIQKTLEKPKEQVMEQAEAIETFLDQPNWNGRIMRTLSGFVVQGKSAYVSSLMELLVEGGRPAVAEVMQRINYYIEQNALMLALEEAHYAVEKSPDYLPAHRRIADVLTRVGRTQEAAEKLNLVAETYLIRGNPEKAADLFQEVINIWPADIDARERLLSMLKEQGRVDEALGQYVQLGDLYYRLRADVDKAQLIYVEGIAYAEKNNSKSARVVAILKSMADIEQQRLNWQKARDYYERIAQIAPDDDASVMALVDLDFQLGRSAEAIKQLDNYMRTCITRGKPERILPTLEKQARRHPKEIALRMRLAQVYMRAKRREDAIAQLDEVGELQIEAGDYKNAIATITQIIKLNPPDADKYRQLVEQLKSSLSNF